MQTRPLYCCLGHSMSLDTDRLFARCKSCDTKPGRVSELLQAKNASWNKPNVVVVAWRRLIIKFGPGLIGICQSVPTLFR